MDNLKPIHKLKPFTQFCCSIGAIPTSYLVSLTYEEQLLWLCDFIKNQVIPTVNNNGLAVEELQNLFKQLTEYVNHYFDNLDVQQEIDNKLDEMASDGTLYNIIVQFLRLNATLCFENINEMKNSINLMNGSYARTMGYYSKNDGGNAFYKIRFKTSNDNIDEGFLININENLVAEMIINNDSVNLNQLGAKVNDETFDNYNVYMKAINKGISTIILLNGNYYFTRLVLYSHRNIIGKGANNTYIKAMLSSYSHFISLDYGPIIYNLYKGFTIEGNLNNSNQTGLYIYGLPAQSGIQHGGLWNSRFEQIVVRNFTDRQIYFEGKDPNNTNQVPNQFLLFNQVQAFGSINSGNVLEIHNQAGQFEFNNCQFDGAKGNNYNIWLQEVDCLFNLLTCQGADYALYTKGVTLTLLHPWFENINKTLIDSHANETAFGDTITIKNGSIRNCCTNEDFYAFFVASRCSLSIENTKFLGGIRKMFNDNGDFSENYINFKGNFYNTNEYPLTWYKNPWRLMNVPENGIITVKTTRVLRLAKNNHNIIGFNFQDRCRDLDYIDIYAHENLTFTGDKILNPIEIPRNSSARILRINKNTDFEQYYVCGKTLTN